MIHNVSFKANLEMSRKYPEYHLKGKFDSMKEEFEKQTKDLPDHTLVFADFGGIYDEDLFELYEKDKKVCEFSVDFSDWNSSSMCAAKLIGFLRSAVSELKYAAIFEDINKKREQEIEKINQKYGKKFDALYAKKWVELAGFKKKYKQERIIPDYGNNQQSTFDIEDYWEKSAGYKPDIDKILSKITNRSFDKQDIAETLNEKEKDFLSQYMGIKKEKLFSLDKATYKENALKFHPDKNDTEENKIKFQILNLLSNSK